MMEKITNRFRPKFSNLSHFESTNWQSVDGGGSHTVAIKEDGTLWVWGNNDYAKLGDGTTTDSLIPIRTTPRP